MSDGPLVTVTVAVRDGVDWVDDCLRSLVDQTYRPLEVVAVDDGSSDGSTELLREWQDESGEENGLPIRVILQQPLGLSAARQAGLEESKGEWLAITDIDCRPHPTWIEHMVAECEGLEDENVVSVTGRVIFAEGDTVVSRIRSQEIASKYRKRSRRTTLANGPCSMFRKKDLESIGGFDPGWYHAEDMEVSLKLLAVGGVIIHTPDAVVQHVPESSLKVFLSKRRRDARAHMRIVRRYPQKRRQGPGFDFVGRAWFVLALAPFLFGITFLLLRIILTDVRFESSALGSRLLMLMIVVYLFLGLNLMRAYLGTGLLRTRIGDAIRIPLVLLLWSISLWQGIILGLGDALTGRHGHR